MEYFTQNKGQKIIIKKMKSHARTEKLVKDSLLSPLSPNSYAPFLSSALEEERAERRY